MGDVTEQPRRVLLVDDVAALRELARRTLADGGYRVDVAATLAEARAFGPGGYHAVVIDAGLGEDDGTDLVREMMSQDPAAAGRCLLITGGTAAALPPGVRFLLKPFHPAELLGAVRSLPQADPATGASAGAAARIPASAAGVQGTAGGTSPAGAERLRSTVVATATEVPRPREAPGGTPAVRLLETIRLLRTCEREELAEYLHQGPIQDIAAATLALHRLEAGARPELAGQVSQTRQLLDEAARSLRRLMDGQWPSLRDRGPFLRPEDWLAGALRERTGWLLAAPMTVDVSEPSAGLGAAEVPRVVDVAELLLFAMTGGNLPAEASATVAVEGRQVTIGLTVAQPAAGGAGAALTELAAALGAGVRTEFFPGHWRAVIGVPRQPGD
jgi:two-component system response regulator MprA